MDRIETYTAFARMMELGNFSAVGRQMAISQSKVSKHIAALEAELRVQLFVRTTRKISPTIEAIELHEYVQRILESVEAVRDVAGGQRPEPYGFLRVSMPLSFGRQRIMPLLPMFLDRYPQISVDAVLSDAEVDLVKEGFELAFILGEPRSGSLIARNIRVYERRVVAAPAYLARHGTPLTPVDLAQHALIASTQLEMSKLAFDSENGREVVACDGRLRTNSDEAAFDAALAGHGIAVVPSWLVQKDLAAGGMVLLLPDYSLPSISVMLAYPQTRFLSRRARHFIDFVVQHLIRDGRAG